MKTKILLSVKKAGLALLFASAIPALAFAQAAPADDTASSVAAGQQLWQKLEAKQVSCSKLSEANFESLGEYFMGTMMGNSHETMNGVITARLGDEWWHDGRRRNGRRHDGLGRSG